MRVQHRFGGIRDENKNGSGMRDCRNFNCGMRDKTLHYYYTGAGFAQLLDSFKIDGTAWDGKQNLRTLRGELRL